MIKRIYKIKCVNKGVIMEYLSEEEIKKIEFDILFQFHNYCIENDIYYTLAGGTLLGAIRHKGFIPWDDDIDVMLPRLEYNKLLKKLIEKPISEDISLIGPGHKNYYYPFAKLQNHKTVAKMEDNLSEHGVWIDIFPLDNLPEDDRLLRHLFRKTRFMRALVIAMTTDLKKCGCSVKKIVKIFMLLISMLIGKKRIIQIADRIAQTYNDTDSEFIGGALWGYGVGERMSKSGYMESIQVEFENYKFNAPSCWDSYLTGLYGDYTKYPPIEQQKSHAIYAWYK